MKNLLALALVAALGACNGGGPPPVEPTPPPTPEPVTAVRTDMLLRQQNAKLQNLAGEPVHFTQAVQCCGFQDGDNWNSSLPGVSNHRWPLISAEAMDFFAQYKFNAFHFRLGPFYGDADHENLWSDIGGAYAGGPGSAFNPAFYDEVEKILAHAAVRGWWVEVVVVDTWYCKRAQWGDQQIPWSNEAIQSCGRTPGNAEVEAFIRQNVRSFTKYGNVIWSIDNEGSEIQGAKREWFEWVRDVIRDEEQKHPSKHVHLIGTNSDFTDVADFVVTHARAALAEPVSGRWTLNNERNPEFSPEQEASNFKVARDLGLSYSFWRAEMKEAPMLNTLERMRDIISGGGAPVGCFPPAEDDPLWVEPPQAGSVGTNMRPALEEAKAQVPQRCGTDHAGSLETLDILGAKLRELGYCAGRMTDSVFIKNPEGFYQEFHAVAFSSGCWANDPAQLPKNTWTYSGTTAACAVPVSTVDELLCKEHQATNHIWDCTPKAGGQPILPEGDPQREACERKSCGGFPSYELNPVSGLTLVPRDNPYQFRVAGSGTGTLNCFCPATGGTDLCNATVTQ